MATRSLTEIYILLRNNAQQNKHIYSDQHADDKTKLISASVDVETGNARTVSKLPPEWVDCLEEMNYDVTRIKQKMKDLNSLHDKHLHRPTLDDSVDEERQIEFVTKEITSMINKCQDAMHKIDNKSRHAQVAEKRMAKHVTMALAGTLQELTMTFRKSQSAYLSRMQTREERSRQYFGSDIPGSSSIMIEEDAEAAFMVNEVSSQQTQAWVEENTQVIAEREREINEVVRSIQDLNQIFRDLSQIVIDQGTILDRIDYNIEQTSTRVEQGFQQLQKAEKYQKGNRKMMCIIILAIIVIILVIILIAIKS